MALDRMDSLKRTHYCGTLRTEDEGKEVVVCGWAQRQRDLGGLIFIDLRGIMCIKNRRLCQRIRRSRIFFYEFYVYEI